jgi:hypothetical protein
MMKLFLAPLALCCLLCAGCASDPPRSEIGTSGPSLAELQARYAIEKLQARYFQIIDLTENKRPGRPSAAQAVEELFTDDATWRLYADGQVITEEAVFRGREELIEFMTLLEARYVPGVYIKHVSANPQISVAGNTAQATEQLLMLVSDKNKQVVNWYVGHYEDVLERDAAGTWKFKVKTLRMEDLTYWASLREGDRQ